MFHIVLLEPEIPSNTGNIGRTCVATGTKLHLIEPLGFRLNEKNLKRAGMDTGMIWMWKPTLIIKISWRRILEQKFIWQPPKRQRSIQKVRYEPDCYIMFGKESAGIPEEILVQHKEDCIRIPMIGDIRSLNLGNSAAIICMKRSARTSLQAESGGTFTQIKMVKMQEIL